MCLSHKCYKSSQTKNEAKDKANGDRDVRNSGEPRVRPLLEGVIDEVGVVVTDKSYM